MLLGKFHHIADALLLAAAVIQPLDDVSAHLAAGAVDLAWPYTEAGGNEPVAEVAHIRVLPTVCHRLLASADKEDLIPLDRNAPRKGFVMHGIEDCIA
jgi:hypothetical protein